MNWNDALKLLDEGKAVRKTTWRRDSFIFIRPAEKFKVDQVSKFKSIPEDAKNAIVKFSNGRDVFFHKQIAYCARRPDGTGLYLAPFIVQSMHTRSLDWEQVND